MNYEAYQHFLILKSCADLQKFGIIAVIEIERNCLSTIDEEQAIMQ
jgi:hypothetical protein